MTRTRLDTLPGGRLLLTAEARAAHAPAAALIAAFLTPATVARWWTADLTAGSAVGEPYTASFAGLGQTMRGEILAHEPGRRLAFSWAWDHEPGRPVYRVDVHAADEPDGARLTLTHGAYTADEEGRADAESHRAGWEYFLPRLLGAAGGG